MTKIFLFFNVNRLKLALLWCYYAFLPTPEDVNK